MSGGATFHRTLMVVEVLGNEPYQGDAADLARDIVEGDFSGAVLSTTSTEVTAEQMSALLTMQGSDPSFLVPEETA